MNMEYILLESIRDILFEVLGMYRSYLKHKGCHTHDDATNYLYLAINEICNERNKNKEEQCDVA